MIDQASNNEQQQETVNSEFSIYKNKKSPMNESILIQYDATKNSFSLHVYAIILPGVPKTITKNNVIDTRILKKKMPRFSLSVINQINTGSLSFNRIFLENPKQKKHYEELKKQHPKRKIRSKRYFPPYIMLIAHYCNYYSIEQFSDNEFKLEELITNFLVEFDNYLQDDVHQSLKLLGKPLYLKGETALINYHQTRDLANEFVKNLLDEKLLRSITSLKDLSYISNIVYGSRMENENQFPLFKSKANPKAISHIIDTYDNLVPIEKQHFPITIIGEATARRNLILNLLKNVNARFIILDPKENYGKLANANPRIRGYSLGENYFLNIISTEGDSIREQIYAYWFSKIIAHLVNLKAELTKTLETYLLGVYRDESNQTRAELQFKDFANQELTSEVTKMGRNESVIISNVLYPLGTYDEISILTRVGRSNYFDTLFDTKGTIIQFARNDDQLTKIAYLFTLLKMLSIQNDEEKVLVLENLDDIIGLLDNNRKNELSEMILNLSEHFNLIIGARSPFKIKELFKNSRSRFVNRLVMPGDIFMMRDDYNLTKANITSLGQFKENEYLLLMPESSISHYLKVNTEIDTKSKVNIEDIIKESSQRILHSKEYLRNEGIAPEVKKALFELIRILREKPQKMIPEEGVEQLIEDVSTADILRAKEIARNDSLIKVIENSPEDSSEKINLLKLTDRGEEYYMSYLELKKQIPLISIKNLTVEKNFEKEIFEKKEKMDRFFEIGDNNAGIDCMLDIAIRLLGALPQEERFISGLTASKILEHWSYISALKKTNNPGKAKRTLHSFSQLIINGLKQIKNQVIMDKTTEKSIKSVKKTTNKKKKQKSKQSVEDEDFEYTFDLSEKTKDETKNQSKAHNERAEPKESSTKASMFKEATKDLKSAGLKHKDASGEVYDPKKDNIFDDDFFEEEKDLELLNENPFVSSSTEDSASKELKNESLKKLAALKKSLMTVLSKQMNVPFIDDEDFIWHCLETRFTGKLDDGYTISDFVSKMKKLYSDIETGALISDSELKELKKLLYVENLASERLLLDLKQYVQDN